MRIAGIIIILVLSWGCNEKYTPKPRGYFRIGFPEKVYVRLENSFPYDFEIPIYAVVQNDTHNPHNKDWINISIPENKAEIHISHYHLNESNNGEEYVLYNLMEETRELAYKHTIKANAIEESIFINEKDRVFGTIYRIKGNAASPVQFFLTDSTSHFLRGALYIREVPNIDSLGPVINFLEPDVIRIIESTSWK